MSILSPTAFILQRERDGKVFRLVDGSPQNLAPLVEASVGSRGQHSLARISIEAPRSIEILSGELYREKYPNRA
ncbi:MAG TPA: hypothetical protein VFX38_03650 [Gammaproteobacteria bacterium]|nr:hypothetical protein [Gammaproteobacteria bacterium]